MGLMARYRAEQNDNGTYSIFGVPIFGELAEGERGNANAIDRKWMEKAIDRAKLRQGEGYKYRLHILHHDSSTKPQPAGEFKLTKVRPMTYEGRRMDVLHADFLNVPEHVFESIQRGELLYRSVEINNIKGVPEIDSVALLSTETPFFRLPVTDGDTVQLDSAPQLAGMVAFQASGDREALLFRDKESTTMKKATLRVADDGVLEAVLESGKAFRASPESDPRQSEFVLHTPEGNFSAFMDKDEKDDSDEVKKLKATIAKLRKQLEDKGGKGDDKESMRDEPTAESVKLQARVDALEANATERESKDKAQARFSAALSDLKDAGWHVPAKCSETMKSLASVDNDALLDNYVEEFKATRAKDPKPLHAYIGEENTVPDEVLAFKASGPDDYERAAEISAQFDALKASGAPINFDRKTFIDLHIKSEG